MKRLNSPIANASNSDHGSATIIALIVVGVATVLITGLIWRQELQIRALENIRNRTQAAWLQRAATDFARLVLVEDQRNSQFDHLGESWALPLVDSKVASFLKTSDVPDEIASVTVLGSLVDAQGAFNLRNLWSPDFKAINRAGVQSFESLLDALKLDRNLAQITAQSVLDRGLPLSSVDGLHVLPAYTNSVLSRLSPHLVMLPIATKININTATVEVLMAAIPNLSRSAADAFITQRNRAPLKSLEGIVGELSKAGMSQNVAVNTDLLDVKSQFWLLRTEIHMGTSIYVNFALIQRMSAAAFGGNYTQVVWSRNTHKLIESP